MNIASAIPADLSATAQDAARWRSLRYFSVYRILVAAAALLAVTFRPGEPLLGTEAPRLFAWTAGAWLCWGVAGLIVQERWRRDFDLQLSLHVSGDILHVGLMLFASGGGQSGLAMLLFITLAWAGLVGQGRLVLFYAALATVALLFEQAWRVLYLRDQTGDFFRTGLTSAGLFGSAIVAHLLARRVHLNENLARRRGLELADQMRINERVIRDMQDGVLVVDAAGAIRQANPQAGALLGVSLPATLDACAPELAEEYRRRQTRWVESETVLRPAATGRPLRARFLPSGEAGAAVIFLADVGRTQQEAQQLKLAALGRLTANMAHEIRNPLAAISHAAELLGEGPTDAGTRRLVRIIGDNTHRLDRLVAEVGELGRRDRVAAERIDLPEFLRLLVDELALRDPAVATRIALDLPAGATACFDRGHLQRVVTNLLDNALRHASAAAGAIRVSARPGRTASRLALHCVDDGPGIPAALRNRMFEPFFTTRAAGMGLGLYIARELCEANGARLFMLDDAPGAHFCISCLTTCREPNLPPAAS